MYAEGDLFTPAGVRALRAVHAGLAALPFVTRVDSLVTVPDLRDEGGALVTTPLLAGERDDPGVLLAIERDARENPLLRRTLLSEDGRATLFRVEVAPEAPGDREQRASVERLLRPHREAFEILEPVGGPALRATMLDYLARDQQRILAPTLVLLYVLLAFALRSAALALIPILCGLLGTVLFLGALAALGMQLNLLTAMLPALILVIGGMEDVHIVHEYRERLRAHGLERLAVYETTERIGLAVTLNVLTTALGFASTALTDIPILRSFGLTAALAMGLRFACTLLVVPALLGFLVPRLRGAGPARLGEVHALERLAHWIVDRLAPRVRWAAAAMILFSLAALVLARDIPRSNDLLSFVDPHDPVVRSMERAERNLAGFDVLHVMLESSPGDFARPADLARIAELAAWLRSLPGVDAVTSVADVIARLTEQLHADPARRRVPEDPAELAQLLLFVDPSSVAPYVTADWAAVDLAVRVGDHDAAHLVELAETIRGALAGGRFGPQVFTLGGRALTVAESVESITWGQVLSLGSMIAVLFVIVSVLFVSLRAGLVAVAVNVVAVFAMFGVMGVCRVPLNVATCMVAAVTLGIVIDDTQHLLVRFSREVRRHKDERLAIRAALAAESGPLLATSAALAGGFGMLAFSTFTPVRQFGLLSAAVIVFAVVADMLLSPVLLANTRIVTLWATLSLHLRQTVIRRSPFFRGLSRWQAKRVVLASNVEKFEAGTRIITCGTSGDTLYVILSGAVEISVGEGAGRTVLARFGEGDVFGELGLFEDTPRSADVTATEATRVLVWSRASVRAFTRFSPYLAARLMTNIARLLAARQARLNLLVGEARAGEGEARTPRHTS